MTLRRVQLSRAAGWRMPENTIKVDRSTRWGNPFIPGVHGPIEACLADFAELAATWDVSELAGKNLACWCREGAPCHADILLQLANVGDVERAPFLVPVAPFWNCDAVTLYAGDALRLLQGQPSASVDVVCTDPPYSSGGLHRSDRNQKTSDKYVLTGTAIARSEFHGDNRDQRSFTYWCTLWLAECLRIVKPGGVLMVFTDWRQLPAMSDAIQAAGWVWRGFVPWDKTEAARPQKAWFRTGQCEHVMLATHGGMIPEQEREGPCLPGVFRGSVKAAQKQHMTGKPVELMKWLLSIFPAGTVVLDPFLGSGTTLVAAKELGMQGIGMELSPANCQIAADRLAQDFLPVAPPAGVQPVEKHELLDLQTP